MTVVHIDRMPLHGIHQGCRQQRQLALGAPESDLIASAHCRDKALDDSCDVLAAPCDADANEIEQAELGVLNYVLGEFFERRVVNEIGKFFAERHERDRRIHTVTPPTSCAGFVLAFDRLVEKAV
jgi:hypothetical protein